MFSKSKLVGNVDDAYEHLTAKMSIGHIFKYKFTHHSGNSYKLYCVSTLIFFVIVILELCIGS